MEEGNGKGECYLIRCLFCGHIKIATKFFTCSECGSNNLWGIPINDSPELSFEWLHENGFPFLKEQIEAFNFGNL
jgi:hypothetical protein